jgi:alpha-L-rhamnosidase
MRRYVDRWLPEWAPEHLVDSDLGDWVSPGPALTTLAPTAYSADIVARLAAAGDVLGKRSEAARDRALHAEIRTAFEAAFFDPSSGLHRESPGEPFSQTAQVLPLAFGLAPEERRAELAARIADDVAARGGNLATGIAGTRFLLEELTAAGFIDVAYGIVKQTDAPSWGHWLELGYTALSENWGESFRSIGHHMLGSVGQWLVEDLAGIEPLAPGYAEIEFRPEVPSSDLDEVESTIDTVRGVAATSWRRTDGGFAIDVVVPPNATGLVHVPAADPADVAEIGEALAQPADRAPGVELLRVENGRVVYRVGSGRYDFRVGTARP